MQCFIAKATAFCFKHGMLFDERTNRRVLLLHYRQLKKHTALPIHGDTPPRWNVPDVSGERRVFLPDKSQFKNTKAATFVAAFVFGGVKFM